MKNPRTLTELRNGINGRIYIYLADQDICKKFLKDAEAEGYRFGKVRPTESECADIIALEKNKQLSYVGFVGHMAFQCPSGVEGAFYRIDYRKFSSGNNDYLIESGMKMLTHDISGRFYKTVCIVGENCIEASDSINSHIDMCECIEQEDALYSDVSERFDVTIFEG